VWLYGVIEYAGEYIPISSQPNCLLIIESRKKRTASLSEAVLFFRLSSLEDVRQAIVEVGKMKFYKKVMQNQQ
jgi:hypothetical protein